MKKRMISLCMAVVLLVAMMPQIALNADAAEVVASGTCGANLTWTLDDEGTLAISGMGEMDNYGATATAPWYKYREQIHSVIINDGVTSIGDLAFWLLQKVTNVSISNSVTIIGESAFSGVNITELTIPDSVVTIGNSAFNGCGNLKNMYISEKTTTIGIGCFTYCVQLEGIWVGEKNAFYCSDSEGVLYSKDMSRLIVAPAVLEDSYSIPQGVTTVEGMAFSNTDLTTIYIPESVEIIDGSAVSNVASFSGFLVDENNCHFVTDKTGALYTKDMTTLIRVPCAVSDNFIIPDSVEYIGDYAFVGCKNMTQIVIPRTVKEIYGIAFANCVNLAEVYFTGDKPYIQMGFAFQGANATAYYPVNNETWDKKPNIVGINDWIAIDFPNYDGFWLDKDGWSFANAAESFAEEPAGHAGDYYIPRERYDALYGKAYVDAQDDLFTTEWGGNCAGMSATAILFFLDKLDWESIDAAYTEDFANPNDFYRTVSLDQKSQSYYPAIGNNNDVTRLIEAYQLYINAINRSRLVKNLENTYFAAEPEIGTLQGVNAENEPIVTTNYTYRHIPASEGGTYIASMLTEFQKAYDENKPLLIALHGDNFGHGIVARTDLKPEDMGDGWWRVYVYDPNKPYLNESVTSTVSGVEAYPKYKYGCNELIDNGGDIYIELNPTLNQWRYCTSVNSNSSDSYIGSTDSGELLWNGVYAENENNEQYHILRPDFFYTIDLTNFTMEDYANPHFDSTSAWIPENELAIAVDGDTDCSIYASTGELVAIVEDGDAFVLTAAGGFSSYIGQSEDGGSLGGTLYLPNDVYAVSYTSGSVRFFGSDNVLSFSCEGAAELTVDITQNFLQIIAQEDAVAAVKCANVISSDECAYVDTEGALVAGETFTIAYSDDNEVEASTDSKDGEFQLFQKSVDQVEPVAAKVIKAGHPYLVWVVIGAVSIGIATVLLLCLKKRKRI